MDITDAGTATDTAWSLIGAVQSQATDAMWSLGLLADHTVTDVPADSWALDLMTGLAGGHADRAAFVFLDTLHTVASWLLPLFPH